MPCLIRATPRPESVIAPAKEEELAVPRVSVLEPRMTLLLVNALFKSWIVIPPFVRATISKVVEAALNRISDVANDPLPDMARLPPAMVVKPV